MCDCPYRVRVHGGGQKLSRAHRRTRPRTSQPVKFRVLQPLEERLTPDAARPRVGEHASDLALRHFESWLRTRGCTTHRQNTARAVRLAAKSLSATLPWEKFFRDGHLVGSQKRTKGIFLRANLLIMAVRKDSNL